MARFYASDVLYKDYTAPAIAAALHSAGIAVGAPNGQTISAGQFLPSVDWLLPSFIATELGTTLPGATGTTGKATPGPARPLARFGQRQRHHAADRLDQHDRRQPGAHVHAQLHQRRDQQREQRVCKVSVTGTSVSGQTVVPADHRRPARHLQGDAQLPPSAGTQSVVATIEPVLGEKNKSNNTLDFPVTFQ